MSYNKVYVYQSTLNNTAKTNQSDAFTGADILLYFVNILFIRLLSSSGFFYFPNSLFYHSTANIGYTFHRTIGCKHEFSAHYFLLLYFLKRLSSSQYDIHSTSLIEIPYKGAPCTFPLIEKNLTFSRSAICSYCAISSSQAFA